MRSIAVTAVACVVALNLFAGRPDLINDLDLPLKNWVVPSAAPLRIGTNAAISSNASFIAIEPCRAVDTRDNNAGALGGGMIADNATRSFALRTATNCNVIPANVKAYSVNVAVFGSVQGPTDNFIIAFPTGSAQPNTATLNFAGGQTLSNAALVPAGTGAAITIYTYRSTHIAIDVNGYFVEPVTTSVTARAGLSASSSGPGNVTLTIPALGVTSSMLAGNAVTTGAIQDSAVTAAKIATGQVVKNVNGLTDGVTISGPTVSTAGSTIIVNAGPSGSMILGTPGDTNLIGAGYTEVGPSNVESWKTTSLTNAPAARNSHTAVWTGAKMIVWGGNSGSTYFNTGSRY